MRENGGHDWDLTSDLPDVKEYNTSETPEWGAFKTLYLFLPEFYQTLISSLVLSSSSLKAEKSSINVVVASGLEPPTPCMSSKCSNQTELRDSNSPTLSLVIQVHFVNRFRLFEVIASCSYRNNSSRS